MAFNDSNYAVLQGSLFMQPRLLNGTVTGSMFPIGDCDMFQISPNQKFEDIQESQSGLGLTAFHVPTETKLSFKANLKNFMASNIEKAVYGTYGGGISAGTVTAELSSAYNDTHYPSSIVPFANPGVSSVVMALAGVTGTIASIAVTAGGSGYTPSTAFALTITGSPGTGATGFAYSNAAGVIVGALVSVAGTGYVAPTAVITTPGAGTGATLQVNMGAAPLVLNTDYTIDAVNGDYTVTPTSLLIPKFTKVAGLTPTDGTYGKVGVTAAYSYGAYTGKIEAFTTGIQYFSLRLKGFNTGNAQPVIVTVYQSALNMAKVLDMIAKKSISLELDGEMLLDTTKSAPTVANPTSQFFNIAKG